MRYRGELFHIYKILESLDDIQTQTTIGTHAHLSNWQLNDYLTDLYKLDYIQKASEEEFKGHVTRKTKFWKITHKGIEFKNTIKELAELNPI